MKTLTRFIILAAVAGGMLAQTLHAGLINGAIGIGGDVFLNASSPATATAVTGWIGTQVTSASGSFTNFITPVAPAFFNNSQSWYFNTTTPFASFWTAGGFMFQLSSSFVLSQGGIPGVNGFVVTSGTGVVSGNGFTPTACTWSFTAQGPEVSFSPPLWAFSSECTTPPLLLIKMTTNAVVLSWSDPSYALQAAPTVGGTYAKISGATSPYTNPFVGPQQYFRLNK